MGLYVYSEQNISPGLIYLIFTFPSAFPHFPLLFLLFGKLYLYTKVPDSALSVWTLRLSCGWGN